MALIGYFALLLIAFLFLWKAGALSVKYAIEFSLIYEVESFAVGFFIFAISTGLPEIISVFVATFQGVPALSAGDLLGSSLFNVSFILAVAIFFANHFRVDELVAKRILKTIIIMLIIYFGLLITSTINRLGAILLITIYFGAMFWFRASFSKKQVSKELQEMKEALKHAEKNGFLSIKLKILLKLMGSLVLLLIIAWAMIYAASAIVHLLSLDLPLFGATFIAIGTGLPELILEIHAVKRHEYSLALGDIFGSSLLNVSLILGILGLLNTGMSFMFIRLIIPFFTLSLLIVLRRLIQNQNITIVDGWFLLIIFLVYLATSAVWQAVLVV